MRNLTKRVFGLILATGFGGWMTVQAAAKPQSQAAAQSAAKATSATEAMAAAGKRQANIKSGTKISTQLQSALDARTAKPGQKVVARVTHNVKQHGRTVIRKGDRLLGHVTSVQSNAAGNAGSQIGVAFDQLQSGGVTSQLNAVVTSVFSAQGSGGMQNEEMPAPMAEPAPMPVPAGGGRAGGGLLGGVGSTVGSTLGSTVGAAGSTVGNLGATAGAATESTLGGNAGANLATPGNLIHISNQSSASSSSGTNSLLSTRRGNLRLNSGTDMQLRVASQTQAQAQTPKK